MYIYAQSQRQRYLKSQIGLSMPNWFVCVLDVWNQAGNNETYRLKLVMSGDKVFETSMIRFECIVKHIYVIRSKCPFGRRLQKLDTYSYVDDGKF